MGKIQQQYVRTKSKPLIAEVGHELSPARDEKPNQQENITQIKSSNLYKLFTLEYKN